MDKKDQRLFIRTEQSQNEPTAVRNCLVSLTGVKVTEVRKVKSGYSVLVESVEDRKKMIEKRAQIGAYFGGMLEESTKWHTYIVGKTNIRIQKAEATGWDTAPVIIWADTRVEDVAREVERATGELPVKVAWGVKVRGMTRTAIVSFNKKINKPFRLFGSSNILREAIERKTAL